MYHNEDRSYFKEIAELAVERNFRLMTISQVAQIGNLMPQSQWDIYFNKQGMAVRWE